MERMGQRHGGGAEEVPAGRASAKPKVYLHARMRETERGRPARKIGFRQFGVAGPSRRA